MVRNKYIYIFYLYKYIKFLIHFKTQKPPIGFIRFLCCEDLPTKLLEIDIVRLTRFISIMIHYLIMNQEHVM